MIELTSLVDAPGASSLPYVDPAFPDRPLALHAARPREYDAGTPVLFVHHGGPPQWQGLPGLLAEFGQRAPSRRRLGDVGLSVEPASGVVIILWAYLLKFPRPI